MQINTYLVVSVNIGRGYPEKQGPGATIWIKRRNAGNVIRANVINIEKESEW